MDAHALGGLEGPDPSRAHARPPAACAFDPNDSQEVALFAEAHSGVHRRAPGSPHVERALVWTMSAIIASAACVWLREHPQAVRRARSACEQLVAEVVAPLPAAATLETGTAARASAAPRASAQALPIIEPPKRASASVPALSAEAPELASAPASALREPASRLAATAPSEVAHEAAPALILLEPVVVVSKLDDAPKPSGSHRRTHRAERREHAHQLEARPVEDEHRWATLRDEARKLYASRKYAEAARAYEQAARHKPRDAQTLAGLGSALLQLGDAHGAVRAFERATRIAPTSTSYVALGRAHARTGNSRAARSAYQHALALDRANAAARRGLAEL